MSAPVAIVTGAAGGIGAATVDCLLAAGIRVCAVDLVDCAAAARPDRLDLVADLADPAAAEQIVAAAVAGFGQVDILVNNAGVGGSRAVHETDDAGWARILDINLGGSFRLSRAVLPGMLARGAGAIVHVASMFGLTGWRNNAAYAASKAGLDGLTRQMTADYAARGIRVNAVAPGLIRTAMTEQLLLDPVYRELIFEGTPVGRMGTPRDVAELIAFLVSDRAGFICGQTILVDGGWTAARVRNHS